MVSLVSNPIPSNEYGEKLYRTYALLNVYRHPFYNMSVCVCVLSQRRQLMRDGFVVDVSESERSLRHLFLYTDLLLCTRFKHANRG